MKKLVIKILIAVLIAVIAGFVFFKFTYIKPLELYPENKTFFEFDIVNITDNCSYRMQIDSVSQHLHCNIHYNYERDSDKPFTILMFHAHELARHLNLADYRYICIDIDPKQSQDFTISMYMYIHGFSDPFDIETHRPYSLKVRVKENQEHYQYKLQDFATPTRWFSRYKQDDFTLPKTNWNQFTHLTISNFENSTANPELKIVLKRLRFIDNLSEKTRNAVIFGFSFFAILVILTFLFKKKITDTARHTPTTNTKYSYEDADKLLGYIEKNLSNPLLSLDLIEKEIGLNNFAVSDILKDKKDTQYKNYIDDLRITEAKRLLTETEYTISAIAEQVGYCYSSSFSRIFGKYCKMTPNEYRKRFAK